MEAAVSRFWKEIKGKKVAFIGLGVSHLPLLRQFSDHGARVIACDKRDRAALSQALAGIDLSGIELRLGPEYLTGLKADVVFRTPGFYFNRAEITMLREQDMIVTSEMEVFFDLCPCKIIAVTGSDGKSTTTSVIAEMLKAAGKRVFLGGNLGFPLLPRIDEIQPEDFAVVELSSFQLISMRKSPDIGVITNVSPNHLDVHGTMEEYIDAKLNLLRHQTAFGVAVLNRDNDVTRSFAPTVRGRLREFSRLSQPRRGCFLREDGMLCHVMDERVTPIMKASSIKLPGDHNVENYLAAMTAVWGIVTPEQIVQVAETFGGVEHRIEFVRELSGVRYYNDSIATSPTRVMAGLRAFREPMVVIMGGYDKKIPFSPMAVLVNDRVRVLILMGATADAIEAAVKQAKNYHTSRLEIVRAGSMQEAVQLAREKARPGDVVTLSPACASFDKYPNFEARGRHFKKIVQELS